MLDRTQVAIVASILPLAAHATALPQEVSRYVEERDKCDHFRGEEPYDSDRKAFLETQMCKYCSGTDVRLDRLKKKYAKRSDVLESLGRYEPHIELQRNNR